jgi:hypothetical protein
MVGAPRKNKPNGSVLTTSLWHADEEDKLNRIVTGEKSQVHHHQLESNCASIQWKHPSSPSKS